jgi:hypothetical protein
MSKTIPQLDPISEIVGSTLFPVDDGIKTYRGTGAQLLAYMQLNISSRKTTSVKTGAYAASVDQLVLVDSSGGDGNFAITLPTAVGNTDKIVAVKDVGGALSSHATPVYVESTGGQTIGGLAVDYNLEADYGYWEFMSDGTNWLVI